MASTHFNKSLIPDSNGNTDKDTVKLVNEVKKKLKEQIQKTKTVTESDVAFATFDVKRENKYYSGDIELIRKFVINRDQKLNDLFDISAAYGNNENEISQILKEEQRIYNNDSTLYPKRKIVGSSLDNIISPLKELFNKSTSIQLTDLFIEIQNVRQKDVLRADRMFYIEAKQYVGNLETYTIENAHDQVQAICLMHFEPNSITDLSNFIKNCRTFESAYAYLQNLVNRDLNKGKGSSAMGSPSDRPSSSKKSLQHPNSSSSSNYTSLTQNSSRHHDSYSSEAYSNTNTGAEVNKSDY